MTTATVNYQSEKRGFTNGQRVNVVLYAPGDKCEALPGCPTFDIWCLAFWWPGCREEYRLYTSEDSANAALMDLYR